MTDIVTPETRSKMMSGVRGKNTKPEKTIRRILTENSFRYRLHGKYLRGKNVKLPGKPDIVLTQPQYKTAIFIVTAQRNYRL